MRILHIVALVALACGTVGCRRHDPLFCDNNPEDPQCLGDGGTIDATGVTIGGKVNGLTGAGLVLQNNGGDDKQIQSFGAFEFPTPVPVGSPYEVTVSVEPTNPSQTCQVSSGSGTATATVKDVAVDCTVATYTLGGTVVGLASGTVTLANGTDRVTTGNGSFTFPTAIASGATYTVTLMTGPGSCHVFGGTGTIGNANVTTVVVNCSATSFTIGGTVTGLNGTVQLQDNGGDMISVSANGSYAFPTPIAQNGGYNVTVVTQPTYPPASQTCVVSNGTGTVSVSPIVNVDVACTTNAFHVSGSSTGVTGTIVLQNNGSDDVTQTASGPFMFATPVASGKAYAVTVSQSPPTLGCTLMNASGTIAAADVSNVAVSCKYKDPGITCGTAYCTPGGGGGCCDPEGSPSCVTSSSSCASGTLLLGCDDSADCGPGSTCCATQAGNQNHPYVSTVQCTNRCYGFALCDPNAPRCGPGTHCKPYGLLPGYYSCQ